ncbi:non-structural maintenance of chromosomes element 1 homolog [Mya arenaria]|uniref:non-structural maintenance of chromosomes element 1 homolog n=1 Tax=Mya arenaria TaxID=6604 RepID=UPI0022E6DC75|nr:non-structural maintenance of chromosomes element 1 homolog [Mya arenaria]
MMVLRDSHRMFLQSFMSRFVLNGQEVFSLLKSCCEKYNEAFSDEEKTQLLLDFCHLINSNISMFGMEIKKACDEMNGKSFYGLVNTTETSVALLSSQYTENELDFVKKLIEEFVKSDRGSIGSIAAMDITDSLPKKMSKVEADAFLDRLIHERWIGRTEAGRVYLGIRGLMEMEQYILEMYEEDAVRCNVCKKLCLQGEKCDCCTTKIHNHCSKRFFRDQADKRCPECQNSWPGGSQPSQSKSADNSTSQPRRKRKANS